MQPPDRKLQPIPKDHISIHHRLISEIHAIVRTHNKQGLAAVGNGKLLTGAPAPCTTAPTDFRINQIPAVPTVFLR